MGVNRWGWAWDYWLSVGGGMENGKWKMENCFKIFPLRVEPHPTPLQLEREQSFVSFANVTNAGEGSPRKGKIKNHFPLSIFH